MRKNCKYKNNKSHEKIRTSRIHKPIVGKYIEVDGELIFIERDEIKRRIKH